MVNILDYCVSRNNFDGRTLSKYVVELDNGRHFQNILMIRSVTTGLWMRRLLKDDPRVIHIVYRSDPQPVVDGVVEQDQVPELLEQMGRQFDLIVMDPFHEYNVSIRDLYLNYSLLTDDGIIVSHDCYPPTRPQACALYTPGKWCGETYIALVQFARDHPHLYYAVTTTDHGIGIISKQYMSSMSNSLCQDHQDELLRLHRLGSSNTYSYFRQHSALLINVLN